MLPDTWERLRGVSLYRMDYVGYIGFSPRFLPSWSENGRRDPRFYFWRGLHINFGKVENASQKELAHLENNMHYKSAILAFGTVEKGVIFLPNHVQKENKWLKNMSMLLWSSDTSIWKYFKGNLACLKNKDCCWTFWVPRHYGCEGEVTWTDGEGELKI